MKDITMNWQYINNTLNFNDAYEQFEKTHENAF